MNDNHHHTNNLASDEQASLLLFKPSVVSDPRLIGFAVGAQSLSCIWLFEIPWTVVHQAFLSFTISWSLLRLTSIELVMPSNHLILCHPFTSCLQSFAVSGSFPMSQLFVSGSQIIGASASVSVFPMNIQSWFPLGFTGVILLSRGPQGSSPAPQFETISSSALSLFHFPAPTSLHDYWKSHSFH